jgi:hypothetical protein
MVRLFPPFIEKPSCERDLCDVVAAAAEFGKNRKDISMKKCADTLHLNPWDFIFI